MRFYTRWDIYAALWVFLLLIAVVEPCSRMKDDTECYGHIQPTRSCCIPTSWTPWYQCPFCITAFKIRMLNLSNLSIFQDMNWLRWCANSDSFSELWTLHPQANSIINSKKVISHYFAPRKFQGWLLVALNVIKNESLSWSTELVPDRSQTPPSENCDRWKVQAVKLKF